MVHLLNIKDSLRLSNLCILCQNSKDYLSPQDFEGSKKQVRRHKAVESDKAAIENLK